MKQSLTGLLSFLAMSMYAVAADSVAPATPAAAPAGSSAVFWHDGGLDQNGDGLIDDDELKAALAKRCANLRQALAGQAPSFVRHYDVNGDGKLDDQEIDAACTKLEDKFRTMAKELNQATVRRFDKDGDGVLNAAEKAELKKSVASIAGRKTPSAQEPSRQGRPAGVPAVMTTAANRRPAAEEIALRGEELRRERDAINRERLQKFDQDGDGKLSAEEKAKARAVMLDKVSE